MIGFVKDCRMGTRLALTEKGIDFFFNGAFTS